jgi:surface protein
MFYYCENLANLIGIGDWDTGSVQNMNIMFSICESLTNLDLSRWDTCKVTEMGGMFYGCLCLNELNLSGWDMTNVWRVDFLTEWYINLEMLGDCHSLTTIQTPRNLECEVKLPGQFAAAGVTYTILPTFQAASLTLTKDIGPFGEATFTLPSGATKVEANAFEGGHMAVVSIPAGCMSIGDYAFKDCRYLEQIRIPAGCTLGTDVFAGCGTVYVYGVDNSPAYEYCQTHDNCVFVKDAQA